MHMYVSDPHLCLTAKRIPPERNPEKEQKTVVLHPFEIDSNRTMLLCHSIIRISVVYLIW